MTDRKLIKVLSGIFQYGIIIFALLYLALQVINITIPLETSQLYSIKIRGTDIGIFTTSQPGNENVFDVFLFYGYKLFYSVAILLGLVAAISFARGRTISEALAIFVAFLIPVRKSYSGVVFDVDKKKPVAFAPVRVISKEGGKEVVVASALTDLDGRYRIFLGKSKGKLVIQAKASGYGEYTKELNSLYQNSVAQDIPLRSNDKSQNTIKTFYYSARPSFYQFIIYYLYLLSLLLLLFNFAGLYLFGVSVVNLFNIVFFGFSLAWNTLALQDRSTSKAGKILDYYTEDPVSNAIVRVFGEDKQLQSTISDPTGVVRITLNENLYKIIVSKDGYIMVDEHGEKIEDEEMIINKEGYLPRDIFIKKLIGEGHEDERGLLNPFG